MNAITQAWLFFLIQVDPSMYLVRWKFQNLGGVSNILYFHLYLGKWSNFTNIFQMGWNHHLEKYGPPKFQRLEPENDGLNSKFGISEIPGTEIFRWTMLKFIGISVYSCCFYGAPFGGSFFEHLHSSCADMKRHCRWSTKVQFVQNNIAWMNYNIESTIDATSRFFYCWWKSSPAPDVSKVQDIFPPNRKTPDLQVELKKEIQDQQLMFPWPIFDCVASVRNGNMSWPASSRCGLSRDFYFLLRLSR